MKIIPNSRILITGGAGFIGSHLTKTLLKCGCKVTVLDNFASGCETNLVTCFNDPNFNLIKGDISNQTICESAMTGIEYVLHEAAIQPEADMGRSPLDFFTVNTAGFANVLTAASRAHVKRFVYATTAATLQPNSKANELFDYAISCLKGEQLAIDHAQRTGMETIGLRYFNVFGPYQKCSKAQMPLVHALIEMLLRGEVPSFTQEKLLEGDFLYVDDVVHANLLAMVAPPSVTNGQIYNIARGEMITLMALFSTLRNVIYSSIPQKDTSFPEDRMISYLGLLFGEAKISDTHEALGYEPRISLENGLRKTVDWYLENRFGWCKNVQKSNYNRERLGIGGEKG